ncbi:MAG: aminoacyl-tRNA hydrolase [Chitinispirillaceae bacterium]
MCLLTLFEKFFGKRRAEFKPSYILFGLGNPGDEYEFTRHNVGFRIIDRLQADLSEGSVRRHCSSVCVEGVPKPGLKPLVLVKPLTFMNRSGVAVKACLERYGLPLCNSLVIVDDFNIPLGTIRFRKGGSHGGHNGLKSISSAVGSDFPRMRVGIGPLPSGVDIISFVLGNFTDRENEKVQKVVDASAAAVRFLLDNGIERTMNRYNSVPLNDGNGNLE